jgi:hypothetical protein
MLKRPTNCWEHMQCGREPGGVKAAELGICPAAVDDAFDGINTGLAVAFENDPLETGCQLSGPDRCGFGLCAWPRPAIAIQPNVARM